jgi:hypothetical protein
MPPGTFKEAVMMHPDIARAIVNEHGRDRVNEARRARSARQARGAQQTELVIPAIPDTVAELIGDQPHRHVTTR